MPSDDGPIDDLERAVRQTFVEPPISLTAFVEGIAPSSQIEHAFDLYLATACLRGHPAAVREFDRRFGAEIDRGFRRMDAAGDLGQMFRERLLVGDGEHPPKLVSYAGRGPLLHWLRVAVVRVRTDAKRAHARRPDPAEVFLDAVVATTDDPERGLLRSEGRDIGRGALEQALLELSPGSRILLRQNLVEGLSAKQIAALHGVHHATAKRWLQRARTELWNQVTAILVRDHRMSSSTANSLVRGVATTLIGMVRPLLAEAESG